MTGKYSNPLKFHVTRAYRAMLRRYLAGWADWRPMENPRPGYSILIGCNAPLAAMLGANLQLLSRQTLTHLDKVFVVFDRAADRIEFPVEATMKSRFSTLPLEFLYYTPQETRALDRVGLPWGYSWFSWHKALAQCQTRFALLHDFDAMLIRPDIIEERYEKTLQADAQWCGIRYYDNNGITPSMELCTTFEMMLDAAFVRGRFQPIEAFNHVSVYQGRTVDFDTFLYCQTQAGKKLVLPIEQQDMVHPSQVIHQFTELTHRRNYVPPESNNLLFIPYFLYLAGEPAVLRQVRADMESARGKVFPFFGKPMNLQRLTQTHMNWIRKQATRLEQAVAGGVREEVGRYMDAMEALVQKSA